MSVDLDISGTGHPKCKEQLIDQINELNDGDTLTVQSDHDPEPALHQYEAEESGSLDWSYREEGPDDWILSVTKSSKTDATETFDARELPPAERHETILQSFQELAIGESLLLINDHDPKPLFYELGSIHGDTFEWEYQKQQKQEYRVLITKTKESAEMPDEASTRVDVRVIPPNDRHTTIFHRFDLLAEGDAMEIVADHDPNPLRHQLREVHGEESFAWDYRQQDPGEVRVLLKKTGTESEKESNDPTDNVSQKMIEEAEELDVRSHQPQKRHDLVFDRYGSLEKDEAFILVNDHDPKPLYYQMKEEMDGDVRWEYLKQDDGEWKVLIGK
jgi:uncharacterized protein (DUF2249 family)